MCSVWGRQWRSAAWKKVYRSSSGGFVSGETSCCVLCNARSKAYIQQYFLVAFAAIGFTHVAVLQTAFNTFSNLPNDRFSGALRSQWKVKRALTNTERYLSSSTVYSRWCVDLSNLGHIAKIVKYHLWLSFFFLLFYFTPSGMGCPSWGSHTVALLLKKSPRVNKYGFRRLIGAIAIFPPLQSR